MIARQIGNALAILVTVAGIAGYLVSQWPLFALMVVLGGGYLFCGWLVRGTAGYPESVDDLKRAGDEVEDSEPPIMPGGWQNLS